MNITTNGQTLAAANKELARQWNETKLSWSDPKSAYFETKYMQELIASVERALPVFEELQKLLNRVRTDCE